MPFPLAIGCNSAGESYVADLEGMPHLFFSYTEEEQAGRFFAPVLERWKKECVHPCIEVALALSRPALYPLFGGHGPLFNKHRFLPLHPEESNLQSREQFFAALVKEMKRREAMVLRSGNEKLPPMLVIIDDVFEIILSHKKALALSFIRLMLWGKALGMHVIAVSSRSHHHLVQQVSRLTPALHRKFRSYIDERGITPAVAFGAELVITGDELVYYKDAGAREYQRLYATEGPVSHKDTKTQKVKKEVLRVPS